jgi:glycosyltransferase involved in cell wall biosynthesis/multidrug transporter EmrE-like cation transporter
VRILVVSSYPPRHCGIGAYARDQVSDLRAAGHAVTVLTAPDGQGEITAELLGGKAFRVAARIGGRFDRIVVHFQPALYYRPRAPLSKIVTSVSLVWLALRRPSLRIVVHEADPPVLWRPDYLLLALAFRLAGRVAFHTEAERAALERAYHVRVRGALIPHRVLPAGRVLSRAEARATLGVEGDGPVLLCAGFLQPSKAFDRAITAFGASDAAARGARMYVVGSIRDHTPENVAFLEGLRRMAESTPGVTMLVRFPSDAEFDAWIAAADAVVLPYRRTWSSGVLARAQAMGTPAIVTAEGGLAEQAGPADTVVASDAEMAEARAVVRPGRPAIAGGAGRPDPGVASPLDGAERETSANGDRKGKLVLLGLILVSVTLAAVAQLTLKHGINQVTDHGAQPLALTDPGGTLTRIISSGSVWLGLVIFGLSAFVWLIVLSRASLSFAYPFASLTYVIILLFDRFVLDQNIPGIRYVGVAFIIAGIVLISRTNA